MRSGASLSILNVKSQYAMQDASLPLPTQLTSGRVRCFCAVEIDTVAARLHTQAGWSATPDRSRRPQGAMDLRAGSPATERRTGSRPLRGAILARPPPPRAHDHDCLRFPPASPAQNRKAGKKRINGPPPQPTLPAVRQAILELIIRPPPHQCPHCRKWICSEQRRE
jgi:hypothetical protein